MSESPFHRISSDLKTRSIRHPTDTRIAVLLWSLAFGIIGLFAWLVMDILVHGFSHISLSFLLQEPENAGREGGISTIIVSTLLLLLVTMTTALPLSLGTAVALSESRQAPSRFLRLVRCSLDILAAVPSIVFGLFGNAFFCIMLGMGYSILAGGLTLACMILPLFIRTTEQAIRSVPDDYRYAAASLGMSQTSTTFRIIVPAATPGIAAGFVLSIGRALSETAALIFTAGYVTRSPESLFDSGRSMSVHIYDLAMNVPGGNERAYATAAVLLALLLLINATAISFLGVGHSESTGGEWRRL